MTKVNAPAVIGVDWGTSSFRLWVLDAAGAVLAHHNSDQGMARLSPDGFAPVLEQALDRLEIGGDVPTVICGMAGAAQGWVDAGYLPLPIALDRLAAGAVRIAGPDRDIRILPGLAQTNAAHPDVMRGEETQLAGAAAQIGQTATLCMPGTHSKWVSLTDGVISGFSTFLTGELFALLQQHSTLSAALAQGGAANEEATEFAEAVAQALATPETLLAGLFSIRAAPLLSGVRGAGNMAARLSGLLIGAELAAKTAHLRAPVTLVASGRLARFYGRAFALAGVDVTLIDAETLARRGLFRAAQDIWPGRFKQEKEQT